MRGYRVFIVWLSTLVCVGELVAAGSARCADLPPPATMPASAPGVASAPPIDEFREPGNQFEGRFGAFAAGVGSI
jgi:hypothetical protein